MYDILDSQGGKEKNRTRLEMLTGHADGLFATLKIVPSFSQHSNDQHIRRNSRVNSARNADRPRRRSLCNTQDCSFFFTASANILEEILE
jgi:hypothetical protein